MSVSGGWRLIGHLADGSVGLGEDDGWAVARVGTWMGVRGRRRLSSRGERGENAKCHSTDRRRRRSVARDSAGADCGLDRGGKECSAGLFGVEAGVSRELAGWTGSAGCLSSGNVAGAAAAVACARWALHDGTNAGGSTGGAGGAGGRGGGRCRQGSGSDRGGNSCSAWAEKTLTTGGTEESQRDTGGTITTAGTMGRLGETVYEIEAAVVRRLTWRLVPFLFLLYIVAYLDRINVGVAALQMRQQLAFTDAVYGLGAGTFFAGYFFFQVPSNLALQRVGARRWIALLMMVLGVLSASFVLVSGPRSFYLLRFLLGAAEAGFFPGVILYLKNRVPGRGRAPTAGPFSPP